MLSSRLRAPRHALHDLPPRDVHEMHLQALLSG
jgi:hypothetical protein